MALCLAKVRCMGERSTAASPRDQCHPLSRLGKPPRAPYPAPLAPACMLPAGPLSPAHSLIGTARLTEQSFLRCRMHAQGGASKAATGEAQPAIQFQCHTCALLPALQLAGWGRCLGIVREQDARRNLRRTQLSPAARDQATLIRQARSKLLPAGAAQWVLVAKGLST